MGYTFLSSTDASFTGIYAWAKKLITDLNKSNSSSAGVPAGAFSMWSSDEAPQGWLLCDGTSYLVSDHPVLFNQIQYKFGGSGNEFKVPDFRDRILMGAGSLVALNATAGADEVTLSIDELPTHTHVIDDPQHTHAFTADAHSHAVNDPGHHHTVTDPGHYHTGGVTATGTASVVGVTGPAEPANTGGATTGITINDATTGITNQNTVVTGNNASALTGVTNEATGNGQAFSVLNPVFGVNVIIKA